MRESVGEACGAVVVLPWRTERARRARAEGESLSGPYPTAREDMPLSDRQRVEGFRGSGV
jgi:hypothetical protein